LNCRTKEVEDGTTKGEGIAIQQLYFNYTVELRTKEVEDERTRDSGHIRFKL